LKFGQWLGLIALLTAFVLLWSLRNALVLLFAAVVLAMALCTLVGAIRTRIGVARPMALLLALLLVTLVVVVVATAVIPPFIDEFRQLVLQVPRAWEELLLLLRHSLQGASQMLYGRSEGSLDWLKSTLAIPTSVPPK